MRTILVGTGFLGSYFADQYLRNELNELIAVDLRPFEQVASHPLLETHIKHGPKDQFKYYQLSAGDPWKLLPEFDKGIDNIVYTAAIADVPIAIDNPLYTHDANVTQTLRFLEFLRRVNFGGHLIMMSSESVLGHQPQERLHLDIMEKRDPNTGELDGTTTTIARGYREDECVPNPSNVYGMTKLAQEQYSLTYFKSYGIRTTVLRSSTMIGPYQRMGQAIPMWIKEVLENQTLTRQGDGSQTRDFIFALNVAKTILKAINVQDDSIDGEVFHVGSGHEYIFDQLAKQVILMLDADARIINKGWRPGEKGLRVVLDCTKAVKKLGHDTDFDLTQIIASLAIYIANNVLFWPDNAVEQLQVSMMRKRPSETRAYQKYLRDHGEAPKDYKEILEPIGPATGKWAGKQWASQLKQSGPIEEPKKEENKFDNMRVSGFGDSDDTAATQKKVQDMAKWGVDPSKILKQAPETVPPLDSVTQESVDAQEKLAQKHDSDRDTMQPQNTNHEEIEIPVTTKKQVDKQEEAALEDQKDTTE